MLEMQQDNRIDRTCAHRHRPLRSCAQRPMLAGVDCCDPNGLDRVFAGRLVRQELRAFRRQGLNSRQREIMALLEPLTPCSSVLDVGCGVGAIGTTLLARGAVSGLFVDVSSAYLSAAREIGAEAGVGERATFYQDDFAASARSYPQADVVVLDRVVCCYPDAPALLEKAAQHSQRTLVYSYPRPLWFTPVFRVLCAFGMRLNRAPGNLGAPTRGGKEARGTAWDRQPSAHRCYHKKWPYD